jgi:hypothetical protein
MTYIRITPLRALKGKIGKLYFYISAYKLAWGGWEISGRVRYK